MDLFNKSLKSVTDTLAVMKNEIQTEYEGNFDSNFQDATPIIRDLNEKLKNLDDENNILRKELENMKEEKDELRSRNQSLSLQLSNENKDNIIVDKSQLKELKEENIKLKQDAKKWYSKFKEIESISNSDQKIKELEDKLKKCKAEYEEKIISLQNSFDERISSINHPSSLPVKNNNKYSEQSIQVDDLSLNKKIKGESKKIIGSIGELDKYFSISNEPPLKEFKNLFELISGMRNRLEIYAKALEKLLPSDKIHEFSSIEEEIRHHVDKLVNLMPKYELDETLADNFGLLCSELNDQGFDGISYFDGKPSNDSQDESENFVSDNMEEINQIEDEIETEKSLKLEAEIFVLKDVLENNRQQKEAVDLKLEGQLKENVKLTKRISDLEASLMEKNSEIINLQSKIPLTDELNKFKELANSLEDEKQRLQQELVTAREEYYSKLEEKLLELDSVSNEKMTQTITSYEKKVKSLEVQLKEFLDRPQKVVDEENKALEENSKKISLEWTEKYEKLKRDYDQLCENLERLQTHLLEKEDSFAREVLNFENKEADLRKSLAQYQLLAEDSKNCQEQYRQQSVELTIVKQENEKLAERISELRKNLANVEVELNEQLTNRDKLVKEEIAGYEAKFLEKEQEIDRLKAELGVLQEESIKKLEAHQDDQSLLEKIKKLEYEIGEKDKTLSESRERLIQLQKKIKDKETNFIEKHIIKNLLIAYYRLSIDKRREGLRMLEKVLDFSDEEAKSMERTDDEIMNSIKSADENTSLLSWFSKGKKVIIDEPAKNFVPTEKPFSALLLDYLDKEASSNEKFSVSSDFVEKFSRESKKSSQAFGDDETPAPIQISTPVECTPDQAIIVPDSFNNAQNTFGSLTG